MRRLLVCGAGNAGARAGGVMPPPIRSWPRRIGSRGRSVRHCSVGVMWVARERRKGSSRGLRTPAPRGPPFRCSWVASSACGEIAMRYATVPGSLTRVRSDQLLAPPSSPSERIDGALTRSTTRPSTTWTRGRERVGVDQRDQVVLDEAAFIPGPDPAARRSEFSSGVEGAHGSGELGERAPCYCRQMQPPPRDGDAARASRPQGRTR